MRQAGRYGFTRGAKRGYAFPRAAQGGWTMLLNRAEISTDKSFNLLT
jgi:hypothetical protein